MSDVQDADQRSAEFVIPDEIRVTLKKPLKKAASDETLTELSFRPPNVGEIKQYSKRVAQQTPQEALIFLLSLLSNDKLTTVDVERMNLIDSLICQEQLTPFLVLKERSPAKAD